MFEQLFEQNTFLGYEYKNSHYHMVFGSAHLDRAGLVKKFPQYMFRFLNQVHGPELIESTETSVEADAHWSRKPLEALVIQTADCQPILFGSSQLVLAAHAGWRGVAQLLPQKTARFFKTHLPDNIPGHIVIGPHILFDDFEVQLDVAQQLTLAHQDNPLVKSEKILKAHKDPQKKYVNLFYLSQQQILRELPQQKEVHLLPFSTLTDIRFHSYRRGKAKADRQYSFIVKL